jgi:hypothetical protein
VTDSAPVEAGGYDELAEAAAREYVDGLAADRRLRAWLLSVSVCACLISLAVTALALLHGWGHRPLEPANPTPDIARTAASSPDQLPVIDLDGSLLSVTLLLPPPGWLSTLLVSSDLSSGTGPVRATTTWIAPKDLADAPQVLAAALTRQGWHRCASGSSRTECWQGVVFRLDLTWGPGESCPSQGPCTEVFVVISKPSPAVPGPDPAT